MVMSFRKRTVVIPSPKDPSLDLEDVRKEAVIGTRPSPLDGRLTISTGSRSLDSLLSGHNGLPLGTSIFVEEGGTTDFGGALLRYFAAEGLVQSHHVHVLGADEDWGRELPGLINYSQGPSSGSNEFNKSEERMKIAWRYERLGDFRRDCHVSSSSAENSRNATRNPFCHDFDLSKRLPLPSPSLLKIIRQNPSSIDDFEPNTTLRSPLTEFLQHLVFQLSSNPPSTIHRVVIQSLLSPTAFPDSVSIPENVLQFLHSLRALLRKHPCQLAAIITLPLLLCPRTTGLTRWMEILSDGVIELAPFPYPNYSAVPSTSATVSDDLPQGMLKVHRLPGLHEKGHGVLELTSLFDDMTFNLSRRKGFIIKPFNLPPVDASAGRQLDGSQERGRLTKADIDF